MQAKTKHFLKIFLISFIDSVIRNKTTKLQKLIETITKLRIITEIALQTSIYYELLRSNNVIIYEITLNTLM